MKRNDWLPTFAHELTHAFISAQKETQNMDSWLDEGLAEWIEERAGSPTPRIRSKRLSDRDLQTASFLGQSRPLTTPVQYRLSYLWIKYLEKNLGGIEAVRALVKDDPNCNPDLSSLDLLSCKLARLDAHRGTFPAEITAQNLIRFFSVALSINHPRFPLYGVSDWTGVVSALPWGPVAAQGVLQGGQFVRWSGRGVVPTALIASDGPELYRLLIWSRGFDILPKELTFVPSLSSYRESNRTIPPEAVELYILLNTSQFPRDYELRIP